MLLRENPFPLPIIHPCSLSLIEASILCIDTDIESDSHSIQGGSNTFKPISSDENHPLIYIYIWRLLGGRRQPWKQQKTLGCWAVMPHAVGTVCPSPSSNRCSPNPYCSTEFQQLGVHGGEIENTPCSPRTQIPTASVCA